MMHDAILFPQAAGSFTFIHIGLQHHKGMRDAHAGGLQCLQGNLAIDLGDPLDD